MRKMKMKKRGTRKTNARGVPSDFTVVNASQPFSEMLDKYLGRTMLPPLFLVPSFTQTVTPFFPQTVTP